MRMCCVLATCRTAWPCISSAQGWSLVGLPVLFMWQCVSLRVGGRLNGTCPPVCTVQGPTASITRTLATQPLRCSALSCSQVGDRIADRGEQLGQEIADTARKAWNSISSFFSRKLLVRWLGIAKHHRPCLVSAVAE